MLCMIDPSFEELGDTFSAILAGVREPTYYAKFLDVSQNRQKLAKELAQFYGAFLDPELHSGELFEALRTSGIWLQKWYDYDPVLSNEQIAHFMEALECAIVRKLDTTPYWMHIGYDYGPDLEVLDPIFRELGIDNNYYYLLPYKTHTYIGIEGGQICLELHFKGPLI